MKKFICFFCTFILIALSILPLSISAILPENDLHSSYSLYGLSIEFLDDGTSVDIIPDLTFDFGSLNSLYFVGNSPNSFSYRLFNLVFTLEIDVSNDFDFYYLLNLTSEFAQQPYLQNIYFIPIDPSDPDSMLPLEDVTWVLSDPFYIDSFDYSYYKFTYGPDSLILNGSYLTSSVSNREVYFYKSSTVPAGHYYVLGNFVLDDINSFNVPISFFVDSYSTGSSRPGLTGNPVLDFDKGYIDFSEATSQIRSELDSVLSDPEATDSQKQIALSVSDLKLQNIRDLSDSRYSNLVKNFDAASSDIVYSYLDSSDIDPVNALSDLNLLYTDALTQAVTPEQGILINTEYSLKLDQLKLSYQSKYHDGLEAVIKDSDFEIKSELTGHINDSLDIEDQVLELFDDSEYQSYLEFTTFLEYYQDDPTVYRSIFEFLFEDNRSIKIQPFLIIPFSLVLSSILLATVSHFSSRRD